MINVLFFMLGGLTMGVIRLILDITLFKPKTNKERIIQSIIKLRKATSKRETAALRTQWVKDNPKINLLNYCKQRIMC